MTWDPGVELASQRARRGLSLDQAVAATRIRRQFLEALERGELEAIPAEAYLRGYLRTYAAYLGLDPGPLLERLPAAPQPSRTQLSIGPYSPDPPGRLTVSGPLLTGLGLLAVALIVGAYVAHQLDSVRTEAAPAPTVPASIPIASPTALAAVLAPTPAASPSLPAPASSATPTPTSTPAPRLVSVSVRTTEEVWLYVEVDGRPFYGASGRFLAPGAEAIFIGQRIKVTSGKAAATMVAVDGEEIGALGNGVASREFAAQAL
jgi:cytoskeletal protein RodZ